jgi:hypothetical protein
MRTCLSITALALALAACNQGNSGNVMAPDSNALDPAEVNAALGPEVTNTPAANNVDGSVELPDNGSNANSTGDETMNALTNDEASDEPTEG